MLGLGAELFGVTLVGLESKSIICVLFLFKVELLLKVCCGVVLP